MVGLFPPRKGVRFAYRVTIMNRRDIFKLLGLSVVGCVAQKPIIGTTQKPSYGPIDDGHAPRDTDGPEYDYWLDEIGKDEMHL